VTSILLEQSFGSSTRKTVTITAVPSFTWGNRESGGVRVWMLEG